MNRKQFLVLLAVLVLLVAAGAGVIYSKRAAWERGDGRIGQRLAAGLKIGNVAEIHIQEPGAAITLKKTGDGWRLRQPEDAPADLGRIGEFLQKLLEVKIVQTEAVNESVRTALQLHPPKAKQEPGAGTVLELKDAGGKVLSRYLLGSKIMKPREGVPAGTPGGVAVGRYVLVGADQTAAVVVSDPLEQVEAKPEVWRTREPPSAQAKAAETGEKKAESAKSEPEKK